MKVTALFLTVLMSATGFAQISKKDEKAINKSLALYEKREYEKAIKKLEPALNNNLDNRKIWEMELEYQFRKYNQPSEMMQQMMELFGNMTDENGNPINLSFTISGGDASELIQSCAKCMRYIENMPTAYIYYRKYGIDPKVDTAVIKAAVDEFNTAEKEFSDKNYAKAILFYKKALDIDSSYYRATLYLGDTYYADEKYESAVEYYKTAAEMQPELLEPLKYLTDAYLKLNDSKNALKYSTEGIVTFPDSDMFRRMKEAAYLEDKKFERNWIQRPYEVNKMYQSPKEIAAEESPWKYYQEALKKIEPYCDSSGIIIKDNDLTNFKHLEVYAWDYMLKNSDDDMLEPARKAKKAGYLNEYVFISVFHPDFWEQYKDYRNNNQQKMTDYLTLYLLKDK